MKLEVGMFVRYKPLLSYDYVKINKIKHIEEKETCLYIGLEDKDLITEKYIIKASHNIIDLIEVGDYVNGRIVCKNDEDDYLYLIGFDADGNFYEDSINNIKSIVTKEQFESIKYSLER